MHDGRITVVVIEMNISITEGYKVTIATRDTKVIYSFFQGHRL